MNKIKKQAKKENIGNKYFIYVDTCPSCIKEEVVVMAYCQQSMIGEALALLWA